MKRALDLVLATFGLLIVLPVFLLVAVLIKFDSIGPVFFRQERIGRGLRPFFIYKFRTMVKDAPLKGGSITFGADPRITRVGEWLRRSKADELPQLLNVLKGEMSLVGPRPEVRKYVELYPDDFKEILQVRPGITDLASVTYRSESEILGQCEDPEREYRERILPHKIDLAKEYVKRSSLRFDMGLVFKTLAVLLRR